MRRAMRRGRMRPARTRFAPGVVGVVLLSAVGVGIRAQRTRLAVGAAVVFTLLMTQA